ncbi:MAG: hypothetical protein EU539_07500 [Promethearchaeota archaeon]|nr:MAG: hypothetical protein EU539_07500 [Candidatus Lokiarchaeota archaeon]
MELRHSLPEPSFKLENLFCDTINDFLKNFKGLINNDIENGIELKFDLKTGSYHKKIFPKIINATPDHAKEIVEIYKDAYNGTYPYKEMEDISAIKHMIESDNFRWFIFKDEFDNTAGCFTYQLDFNQKRGYMRGFILKKKYFGTIDVVKTTIGCMIGIWSTYRDQIYVWYAENRTAHAKAQHMAKTCGIMPIAFFPNKDVFMNNIESDIMHVIYNKKALNELRTKKPPKIIPEVAACFLYSDERYALGKVEFDLPSLQLDSIKLTKLKENLVKRVEKDRFGYEMINLSFKNSNSYFKFLYTPQVQNFEKTKYKVDNLEELFVFTMELKNLVRSYNARYCECFVSAYEPEHQKIFLDIGFKPRGYVPGWNYNEETNTFEDCVVFNYFEGKIDSQIELIKESEDLLKALNEF